MVSDGKLGNLEGAEACTTQFVRKSRSKNGALSLPGRVPRRMALPERYSVNKLIGAGSYGSVYEAYDKKLDGLVAVKRIEHLFDDLTESKRILREIAIMVRLDHESLVQILDVVAPGPQFDELYIVMEICDSDMKHLLRVDVNLSSEHTTTLLYNLLVGLKYLHSASIYHRDLKPANCLVNQDCSVKICDFGLSRAVEADADLDSSTSSSSAGKRDCMTQHVVTRWYRAPELILLQQDYTEAIDMWACGCIYGELLQTHEGVPFDTRSPLFPGSSCFPLSPGTHMKTSQNEFGLSMQASDRTDQLSVIFELIGTPSEQEAANVGGHEEQQYLRCFARREGQGIRRRFPHASQDEQDVLASMLHFDVQKRASVREALNSQLFSQVRAPLAEVEADERIRLDFELEEHLDEELLRHHFAKEIQKFSLQKR